MPRFKCIKKHKKFCSYYLLSIKLEKKQVGLEIKDDVYFITRYLDKSTFNKMRQKFFF